MSLEGSEGTFLMEDSLCPTVVGWDISWRSIVESKY